jgi:formyltetrahydrofolate hydrolase
MKRSVKFFVATSHYVTRIWTPDPSLKMIWCGKDANLERMILARALYFHAQHRILVHGMKTIIIE